MTVAQKLIGISRGFSPIQISGLVAQYDFSKAASLFTDTGRTTGVSSDGQTIKGITDQSTSAAHGSDAVGCTYKTGIQAGNSVGRFVAASSNRISLGANVAGLAQNGDLTVSAAFAFSSSATFKIIFSYQRAADAQNSLELRGTNSAATPTMQWEHASQTTVDTVSATSATDLAWHVQTVVRTSGVGVAIFTDGVANGTPAATHVANSAATSWGFIGADNNDSNGVTPVLFMSGDIGEIVMYSSALGATNRGRVEAYLKAKWGTP